MNKTESGPNIQKSNCRFQVAAGEDGRPRIRLDLFQAVPSLSGTKIEFELMGGITTQQAKALAESINDKILGIVVTQP